MEIKARATFTASGSTESFENRQLTLKTAELDTVTTQSVSQSKPRFRKTYTDPIAQTFLVTSNSVSNSPGIFITSVGVYFAKKPSGYVPITCEIREVVNGYPGSSVLASKMMYSSSIAVSTTELIETKFTFNDLVYLNTDTEYCIVLLAGTSTDFEVWISRMGEKILNSSSIVSVQPHLGSLFKSQNGSTWSADQMEDLTFKLYRAKFDTSKHADVTLVNRIITNKKLPTNPFFSVTGVQKLRVNHPEHGFVNGDFVRFSNVVTGNGVIIPSATTFTVEDVEYDSYIIDISSLATPTPSARGPFGGSNVTAANNIQFSSIIPSLDIQSFTNTDYTVALNPTNTAYQSNFDYYVINREPVDMDETMLIASYNNEAAKLVSDKSFKLRLTMTSRSDYLSPVLNTNRSYLDLRRYKINDPSYLELNDELIDDILIGSSITVDFDYNESNPSDSWIEINGTSYTANGDSFGRLAVGKYIVVDDTAGTTSNKGVVLLITGLEKKDTAFRVYVEPDLVLGSAMVDEAGKTCTLTMKDRYVSEIAPNGSSVYSSYVTKSMSLKLPSDYIRVTMDTNVPSDTTLEVYYRSVLSNEYVILGNTNWTKIEPLNPIINSDTFIETVYEKTNVPQFDQLQIKIVFRSADTSKSPKVKNLRVMALS